MSYSLILLRHGQSTWNLENVFTGWTDVPLTELGREEAARSGTLMAEAGIEPTVVHTSVLRRAIDTANIALAEMDRGWIPVRRHWRLNERHYGALQGENKQETTDRYGAEQVKLWRRSYATPPPTIGSEDPRHPLHDDRYGNLAPDVIPGSECLADVVERMLPYWHDAIVPDLASGHTVLVAAHGNSLRALVKHLDVIGDDDIADVNIPTGIPLFYTLDSNLKALERRYLGDPEVAKAAAAEVAAQAGTR